MNRSVAMCRPRPIRGAVDDHFLFLLNCRPGSFLLFLRVLRGSTMNIRPHARNLNVVHCGGVAFFEALCEIHLQFLSMSPAVTGGRLCYRFPGIGIGRSSFVHSSQFRWFGLCFSHVAILGGLFRGGLKGWLVVISNESRCPSSEDWYENTVSTSCCDSYRLRHNQYHWLYGSGLPQ